MIEEDNPLDLLESVHSFPGVYQIKAIGSVEGEFVERVIEAVVAELISPGHAEHRVRSTPGGRHVAITFDLQVQSAQQVRDIYAAIRAIDGLAFLL